MNTGSHDKTILFVIRAKDLTIYRQDHALWPEDFLIETYLGFFFLSKHAEGLGIISKWLLSRAQP